MEMTDMSKETPKFSSDLLRGHTETIVLGDFMEELQSNLDARVANLVFDV